jgi:hypothetical protein
MKVIVATVCEHAWVENGCLSLCRTFDSISADKFPYTLPRMGIAIRLLARRSEAGEHKIAIHIADADGKELMRADWNLNVAVPLELIPESSFSFALNGQNVVFSAAGDYAVDVIIDSRVEVSIPIYVREKSGSKTG